MSDATRGDAAKARGQQRATQQDRLAGAEGGASAPILFFDAAPVFGVRSGVFSLVLEAFVQDIDASDAAHTRRRVVAHLRTTPEGIRSLSAALERIALMAARTEGEPN